MESVNPILLVAAGTAVVGIASVVICLRQSPSETAKTSSKPTTTTTTSTSKPKKKKPTKRPATTTAQPPVAEESTAPAPEPTPSPPTKKAESKSTVSEPKAPSKKPQLPAAVPAPAPVPSPAPAPAPVTPAPAPAPAPTETESQIENSATDESQKKKKAKETPEQRAARLERQKIAKATKKTSDDDNGVLQDFPDIPLDSFNDTLQSSSTDGWAVVETRKVKTVKKPTAAAAAAAEPSVPGAPPAPVVETVKSEIVVDIKKIGIIVGKAGATLKSIQELAGVEIQTPKDREAKTGTVTISGPAEGVAKASKIINDLSSKGYSSALEGEDFSEGHVSVHAMYIPHIIGKGGVVRKALQDASGVRISVPDGVARDDPNPVKIGLAGPKPKVAEAKKLIKEITKFYHTSVTHPGMVHVEMDVPSSMYNYIIGAKGSEIRHIQNNFKVSVYIPNGDSVTQNLLIVGLESGVENAQRYIQKIIDQATRDKDAAADVADAWAEQNDDEVHEPWMDEFTHPSKRKSANGAPKSSEGDSSAPPSLAAVSQSAWGASILTSAEGW